MEATQTTDSRQALLTAILASGFVPRSYRKQAKNDPSSYDGPVKLDSYTKAKIEALNGELIKKAEFKKCITAQFYPVAKKVAIPTLKLDELLVNPLYQKIIEKISEMGVGVQNVEFEGRLANSYTGHSTSVTLKMNIVPK
ncbi:MAG: hypothetical protein CMH30_02690 [Micavibrio sp.]|nr:hypothetical protein [Micavibrio sp.]|tara:strand:+ start:810 stop:1229 length:420 start_codon:yes stop_codon:yes gene_type:complete